MSNAEYGYDDEEVILIENDYEPLKKKYREAVEKNMDTFEYRGRTILTGYAKYIIQYFEMQKKDNK